MPKRKATKKPAKKKTAKKTMSRKKGSGSMSDKEYKMYKKYSK